MQVVLIAVVSLDGRITRPGESGPGFASPEDQEWFRNSLGDFECAVMGRATYDTIRGTVDAPADRRRLRTVITRSPESYAQETVQGRLEFSSASPATVIEQLRARRFRRCALLGGGQIYREYLDAGVVDAMWLTLEPVVLGGGTPLADGPVRGGQFKLGEMRILGSNTLLLNYHRPDRPLIALPSQ